MTNQTINRDSQSLTIVQPFTSSASIDQLWHVAAESWDKFDDWAASLNTVKSSDFVVGTTEAGAVRSCETGLGDLAETIVNYDEENKVFSYQVIEGRPPLVDLMQATWRFSDEAGQAGGELAMRLELDSSAPEEMFAAMQEQLGGLLDMTAEEFVYYVENGQPHPRKIEVGCRLNTGAVVSWPRSTPRGRDTTDNPSLPRCAEVVIHSATERSGTAQNRKTRR